MILGMGVPELLIILIVVLLIFGPKNLPKLGKSLGKTVKNVREGMEEEDDGKEEKIEDSAAEDVVETDVDDDDESGDAAPEEDVVFCSHCGAKNPVSSDFCSKCGSPLNK